MYLTFDEFLDMGGTLDESAFEDIAYDAQSIIDWWTFDRLQKEETYPQAVKRCMYKLVLLLNQKQTITNPVLNSALSNEATNTAMIASESNDGVSTTYNTLSAKETVESLDKECEEVIKRYLTGVKNSLGRKLLYRGIYPNE